MDKEPKKPTPQDEDMQQAEIRITSVPLMVLIAGVLSTVDFVDWMFTIAEMLVVFVLTYQILGKALFVALVITPILVVFIEKSLEAYDAIMCSDEDDDGDGDDPHFGDHFNNNLK